MDEHSAAIAAKLGVARTEHKARQLTPAMVEQADLVLCMAREHRSGVVRAAPRSSRKAFLLTEFADLLEGVEQAASRQFEPLPPPGLGVASPTLPAQLRQGVERAAAQRGLIPPRDPDAMDVLDPYQRSPKVLSGVCRTGPAVAGADPRIRAEARAGRALVRSLRTWFFYVYIACTLGVNAVILISYDPSGGVADNSIFSASWILLHLLSVLVLLTSRVLSPVPVTIALGIGGLVVLSAAWSVSPMDSLIYGAMAAGNILVACMMAAEYSLNQIARMFLKVLTVLVLAGMAFALIGLEQVMDFDPHARSNLLGGEKIRGFFQHNIMAGFYAATGAVLAMTLLRGIRRVLVLTAFIVFVVWAGSATGLLLAGAAVIIVPLAQLLVPRIPLGGLLAVLVPLGATAGAVLNQVWVPLLEAVGRDPTLTGRTVLWEWGLRAIAERPVVGWGFTGYFNSPQGAIPSLYVPEFDDYVIAHFHNSYIQTAVDLGLLGLLVLILVSVSRPGLRISTPVPRTPAPVWDC